MIITSDGIISQVERYAKKFVFNKLSVAWLKKALSALVATSDKGQGNSYVCIVNTLMMEDVQQCIDLFLKDRHTDGAFLWSKGSNGYVKAGATYDSYTWMGNTISFKLERSLDVEFPDRKYAIMLDLTPDSKTGKPALAKYTFKGTDYVENTIAGVGGMNGTSSGPVSSPVAGSKIVAWGTGSVAVFNPYKSVILMSNKTQNPWF